MAKAPVTIETQTKDRVERSTKDGKSVGNRSRRDAKPDAPVSRRDARPESTSYNPIYTGAVGDELSLIKVNKQVYSRDQFNKVFDNSFEELQRKEDTFSAKQFFELYQALFFDIPKIGANSHLDIIRKSSAYVDLEGSTGTSKNDLANSLQDRIFELETELLQAKQIAPEHPFFRNGTLVGEKNNEGRTGKVYYMDKGFKRQINYTDTFWALLIKTLGYDSKDAHDGEKWFPYATTEVLSQIKTGPNLGAGNMEQATYIENGEMFIGDNVTDDTKDAEIARLRNRLNQIESGDFSTLPALDALSIDVSEIEGIGDDIRTKVELGMDAVVNSVLSPLLTTNNNRYQEFRGNMGLRVKIIVTDVLMSFLNYANEQG